MNEPHKHAEVIKAWADGAKVEFRSLPDSTTWITADQKTFRWMEEIEVRIKPEKPTWYYMRDNHTFRKLEGTPWDMIEQIMEELEAGYTSGSLLTKQLQGVDVHCNYKDQAGFLLKALKILKEHVK